MVRPMLLKGIVKVGQIGKNQFRGTIPAHEITRGLGNKSTAL